MAPGIRSDGKAVVELDGPNLPVNNRPPLPLDKPSIVASSSWIKPTPSSSEEP